MTKFVVIFIYPFNLQSDLPLGQTCPCPNRTAPRCLGCLADLMCLDCGHPGGGVCVEDGCKLLMCSIVKGTLMSSRGKIGESWTCMHALSYLA